MKLSLKKLIIVLCLDPSSLLATIENQTAQSDNVMESKNLDSGSDCCKCPCNQRPKPQAPKPQTPIQPPSKKVLTQCCKMMLEEAITLPDMQLAEDIANIMSQIEKMDESKAPRPDAEPFIVGPLVCGCNNEQLLDCCSQQLTAIQTIINLLNIIIECVCITGNNTPAQ